MRLLRRTRRSSPSLSFSLLLIIILKLLLLLLSLNINPHLLPILIDESPLLRIKIHRRLAAVPIVLVLVFARRTRQLRHRKQSAPIHPPNAAAFQPKTAHLEIHVVITLFGETSPLAALGGRVAFGSHILLRPDGLHKNSRIYSPGAK